MTTISLCMIVYNEADTIRDCLQAAKPAVDEIVVGIDSRTNDDTIQCLYEFRPSRFFYFDWRNDFSDARNQVLRRARGDWVLSLDADEHLTEAGRAAIARAVTSAPDIDAFQLAMEHRTIADDKIIARDWHTRLFKSKLRYHFPVHEDVHGETLCQIQTTEAHVLHYGYDPDVYTNKHKLVRNLDILQAWLEREPNHPQPNYYLAKILFERGRSAAAATHASVALHYGDSSPDGLSNTQKQTLIDALGDYSPQ